VEDDILESLWQEVYALHKKRRLKFDNPYVADMIEILRPFKESGLHRREITKRLAQMRAGKEIPLAIEMDKSVQSSLQRHSSAYAGFKKRNAPLSDDLFYPSRGFGAGWWAVRLDRATEWLKTKNKLSEKE
jgi:hypothetical protein